jgi:hypothetical protein
MKGCHIVKYNNPTYLFRKHQALRGSIPIDFGYHENKENLSLVKMNDWSIDITNEKGVLFLFPIVNQ